MHDEHGTTLHVLPACSSPLALVIRRGPSKWWHFLLWDRDTGVVQPGSWFNGMVYPNRSDLSPKGDWLLLLAGRGGNDPCAWTALCRPPSVSAITFWPQVSSREGGGYFDDRLPIVWLNLAMDRAHPERRDDQPYEFGYIEPGQSAFGGLEERLRRDRWNPLKSRGGDVRWMKQAPGHPWQLILTLAPASDHAQSPDAEQPTYSLKEARGADETPLEGVTWANWNRKGELCLVRAGALHTANPATISGPWRLVMDLNGLAPRGMPAPRNAHNSFGMVRQ